MASGEAEPLQYTTTALRVSIHCEGCRKKVKKVLHSIEGVYKVTVDAAQHKVTVTGSVEAAALVRRLHKAGKQAAPWPSPAPANVEANKAAPAAPGEGGAKEAADTKAAEADAKEKKPAKDKGSGKNAGTGEAADAKPGKDVASSDAAEVIAGPKEAEKASSPEPVAAKPDAAEEPKDGGEGGRKKGKKSKKNKPKDGGEGDVPAPAATPAAPPEKKAPQQPSAVPAPAPGPERPHGGGGAFPCYAAQPVLSYNVAHPSSSVSYCAPTAAVPMPPPPPQMVSYWYPPYPAMVPVPAEFVYGPPGGVRSFPPHESYNNMFNEDNANSCSLM
ncbi:copper chaperone [Zea mays]|uniref:Copper chaperone n=1 Tax=Zea mays TaxID=4577 RepID=B6TJ24_MAIZE|nr:copper chaperone [Zea mays]ACG37107.1 copper chaperone [Zea mays]ONM60719.1 Copper chaperone [Zea mays]|eukprot:NP_001149888.1 copper chaperone [Zea mays]